MVTAFRAGEAFAGAFELTGKAALVALVDWRVGAVIRYVLVAVVPHIFQRLQVVLNVRVFAVANKAAVRQRRVGRFEIDFVVRVNLLLHVEVEAVGVVTLIGHAFNQAELGGIQTAEAVAQVFTWRAVQAKAVAGFIFPLINRVAQALDDGHAFFTQHFAVVHVLIAEQRVDGFVNTDIAQRDRRATVFEDLRHVIVCLQTYAACAFHIEDWCHAGFHPFQTRNTSH